MWHVGFVLLNVRAEAYTLTRHFFGVSEGTGIAAIKRERELRPAIDVVKEVNKRRDQTNGAERGGRRY